MHWLRFVKIGRLIPSVSCKSTSDSLINLFTYRTLTSEKARKSKNLASERTGIPVQNERY